ncbi:YhcH/YjgK/YiaL family protein [Elusimicrobiota bacterium]
MIIDKISNSKQYEKLHSGFREAFEFLKKSNLASIPDGRHEIDGDVVYATIASQKGVGRESTYLEKHSEYIDIHFVLKGEDDIGWRSHADCQRQIEKPEPGKDAERFSDEPALWLKLKTSDFAIFFPEDCHAPLGNETALRKGVIKVAI